MKQITITHHGRGPNGDPREELFEVYLNDSEIAWLRENRQVRIPFLEPLGPISGDPAADQTTLRTTFHTIDLRLDYDYTDAGFRRWTVHAFGPREFLESLKDARDALFWDGFWRRAS
jgi:hypothetical protein